MSPRPTAQAKAPTVGMGWRVGLSIIGGIGWLAFLIVWLFFYASEFSGYQNVAILLLSLLVVTAVVGLPWIVWGRRFQTEHEVAMQKTPGFRWRVVVSSVAALGLVVFLIVWFYGYADSYSIYQNVAVVLVAILVTGGLQGALWAPWGIRHGSKLGEDTWHK